MVAVSIEVARAVWLTAQCPQYLHHTIFTRMLISRMLPVTGRSQAVSAGADGAHTNVTDDGVGTTGTGQLLYSAYP